MEFRVLGPLEAENQGRALSLGGPAERHLLALLLCLANETVPVDRLVDELWGEEPPTTARNMVQHYVSSIRRTMGDASNRLVTEPGGYRLSVEQDELDWTRFARMVTRARSVDSPDGAGEQLREALALWRGPPLAGAGDGATVAAERIRMEEARLSALEERIDCDLELARHQDLVSELEALVGQHPMRERPRRQLMLALYRCDRQAEALRTYADYRSRLGEETGLEPSATLADLEDQILLGSPDLDPPEDTPPGTNLPQRLSSFVGRTSEIAALKRRLAQHRLVTLTGTGGIGKTSLAVHVAAQMQDSYPDGIWLIDLAPVAEPSLIGSTAAGVLNTGVGSRQDPADAVVRFLEDKEALIVLDNCEHLVEGAAEFAAKVLHSGADPRMLATSREPLGVTGETVMRVPSLQVPDQTSRDLEEITRTESVVLFVDRARLLQPEFKVEISTAPAIGEICCRLDGIPLAIELAAARLGTMAVDRIAANVESRYQLLTRGARTAHRRHQTLQALVDWSHDLLTDFERVLFRRLAVFAGTFTADAAEHVCGYDPLDAATVAEGLEQLVDASLINPPDSKTGRFWMLETIREYARGHLDPNDETDTTMRRLAAHLIESGPLSEDGYPQSDHTAWYRWLDDEQDNYRAVLEWSRVVADADVASATTIEFRGYLHASNLNAEAAFHVDRALDLLGDEPSHRRLVLSWMRIGDHLMNGDYSAARPMAMSLYSEAHAAGELGPMGIARAYEAMAAVGAGEMVAAISLFEEASEHLLAAGDPHAMDALSLFAFHLARAGHYESSRTVLSRMTEAAKRYKRTDKRFVSYTANVFGAWVEQYAGNLDEAERLLATEADYVAHLGPQELFMYHLVAFLVAIARGDRSLARAALVEIDRSVAVPGSPGLKRDVATCHAMYQLEIGEPDAAVPFLRRSLDAAIAYRSLADTVEVIYVVGDAACAKEDYGRAITIYAAALAGYERCGIVLTDWQRQRLDLSLEVLRDALGDRSDNFWQEGAAFSFDEMIDYAAEYVGLDPM